MNRCTHRINISKSVHRNIWTLLFCCIALVHSSTILAAGKTEEKGKSHESAASFSYNGFSGGMMLHTGYVWAKGLDLTSPGGDGVSHVDMKGFPYGIGGAIKINFGEHFRFGTEGYVTNLNYGISGSSSKTGWGGLLIDGCWDVKRFTLFFGGTFGGGGTTNITLTEPYKVDEVTEESVSFRKYGFVCLCPYIGFEYALSERVHLAFKVDWMFNLTNPQKDFPTGPRLYVGFMFMHNKNK